MFLKTWLLNKFNIIKKYNKNIKILIILNIIAFIWIIGLIFDIQKWNAEIRTQKTLQKIEKLIYEFKNHFQYLPKSITELKIFAAYKNKNISFYDAFSQRIEYMKLSHEYFILRSFGKDQIQNTILSDHDICLNNIKDFPSNTPQYIYKKNVNLEFYPAIMLVGAYSPNKQWFAKIFSDYQIGKRLLIIINKKNKNLILTSMHDFVEEYLWLPNSYQIIYSATSSNKYQDGIYLWDILKDQTFNLLETSNIFSLYEDPILGQHNSQHQYKEFYISLNGISEDGKKIYAYITPKEKTSLNPRQFFRYAKLIQINMNAHTNKEFKVSVSIESLAFLEDKDFINKIPKIFKQKFEYSNNNTIYVDWQNLPLTGKIDDVINKWQEFANKYADSIILPYFLWYLSSLYSDAFRILEKKDPKKANILRSYGTEIARSLYEDPFTPGYLKAFGLYAYKLLYDGIPLPYSFSNLHL